MRIGAHVPTRGSLLRAIDSARACGAEAAQIWGSNPRAWAPPSVPAGVAREFGRRWRSEGLGPLVLHAPYMVNVASPNADFRRRSVDLAKATVRLAEALSGTAQEKSVGEAASLIWTFLGVMAYRWPDRFPKPGDPPAPDAATWKMLMEWSIPTTYGTVDAIQRRFLKSSLPEERRPWYRRLLGHRS